MNKIMLIVLRIVMALVASAVSGFAWMLWFVMAPEMASDNPDRVDIAASLMMRILSITLAGIAAVTWYSIFAM